MSAISTKLLNRLSKIEPAVKIEKASVDAVNGVAKVLFSTNLTRTARQAAVTNHAAMEIAFSKHLGDKAHLVAGSIHRADEEGYYYGFVKVNSPRISVEEATAENSGFHIVAANVFADADDHIWEVKADASGNKVIVRQHDEDLSELFNHVAPSANMSVAAASISMESKLDFASLTTFLDVASETYHHGVVLDQSHVFDFDAKKVVKTSSTLAVAGTDPYIKLRQELNARIGDSTSTVPEIASANLQDVMDYLNTLYASTPEFLAAYKDAIRKYISL